ncbi:nuclear transport factor 2 family protein [Streptomyces sp. NPDC089424]|uniref:nuclear transport factor 2 family protein n=1 Tax=Streptomyces sp. NPDC089424 TaxID=3365917 RepID=UPI003805EF4B
MDPSTLDAFDAVNVIGRYFQFCDAKDFDGMRGLWTDVVSVDYGGVFPLEGQVEADALKRTMSELLGMIPLTQHMVTTPVVDVEKDSATVRFHLEALHHHPGLGADTSATDWTLYARDVIGLRRTPHGWKVASETLRVVHQTGNTDFVSDLARLAAE